MECAEGTVSSPSLDEGTLPSDGERAQSQTIIGGQGTRLASKASSAIVPINAHPSVLRIEVQRLVEYR